MQIDILKNKTLILASQSPRRQELLKGMEIPFEIEVRSIDESFPNGLTALETPAFIAKKKASAFEKDLKPNTIVITGDTIVWHNNQVLEKPKSADEAFAMLKSMSGTSHQVISAICLLSEAGKYVKTDVATVYFEELTDAEIRFYIDTFKPFDKAGSYGIQEWIGHIGISKIEGSFNTVMGLPTHLLYKMLVTLSSDLPKI